MATVPEGCISNLPKALREDLGTVSVPGIFDYIRTVGNHISSLRAQMMQEVTEKFPEQAIFGTDDIECEFISTLVAGIAAKKVLEVGVFCGFSSLSIAAALPADGHLYALDVSEEFTSVARKYWALAGVQDKITLTLAPAKDTMERYLAEGQSGTFDLIYIDADKLNQLTYYELGLQLLRPGGMIMIDNTLLFGSVISSVPSIPQNYSAAVHELNQHIHEDQRVRSCLLPMADGITLVVKK